MADEFTRKKDNDNEVQSSIDNSGTEYMTTTQHHPAPMTCL